MPPPRMRLVIDRAIPAPTSKGSPPVNAETRKSLRWAAARLLLLCALIGGLVLNWADEVPWGMLLGFVAGGLIVLYADTVASERRG